MHLTNLYLLKKVKLGKYLPETEQPAILITDSDASEYSATNGYDYIKLQNVQMEVGTTIGSELIGVRMKLRCMTPVFEIATVEIDSVEKSETGGYTVELKVVDA